MTIKEFELAVHGQTLCLDASGAAFWREQRTLLLADVHLGKAHTFRRHGIAIPSGTTALELDRIAALIQRFAPARVLVLGDLLHSKIDGSEGFVLELKALVRAHPQVRFEVVRGNHDRRVEALSDCMQFHSGALLEGPFSLCHEPTSKPQAFELCGHIHPVVRLGDANGSVRLKAFWYQASCLVLPSFGAFTGGYLVKQSAQDRLFVVTDAQVAELAPKLNQRRA